MAVSDAPVLRVGPRDDDKAESSRGHWLDWLDASHASHALKVRHQFKVKEGLKMELGLDCDLKSNAVSPWAAPQVRPPPPPPPAARRVPHGTAPAHPRTPTPPCRWRGARGRSR
jgi:hypothetical protein